MANFSVYEAIQALVDKYSLPKGGVPLATAARVLINAAGDEVLSADGASAPLSVKYPVTLAQLQAIGAATSGDVAIASLPAKSVVMFTTLKPSAALAGGRAVGTLTSDATAPSDGDTVTIGAKVYTFKTALTPTEGQVLIGASAAAALDNLKSAINHTGTPDTDYKCAAVHPTVTATTNTDTTQVVQAITAGTGGNSIASTETSSHLAWGAATLATGGTRISAATAQIQTTNNNYGTAFDVHQAPGATVLDSMSTDAKSESFGAATVVNVHVVLTGDTADQLTAGALDAWLTYFVRP